MVSKRRLVQDFCKKGHLRYLYPKLELGRDMKEVDCQVVKAWKSRPP